MPVKAFCRSCDEQHERPVGRKCKKQKVGDTTATAVSVSDVSDNAVASVSNTSQPSTVGNVDFNSLLLNKLTSIDEKLVSLDGRVKKTETAIADRTTDPEASPAMPSSNTASNVATAQPVSLSDTAVIPSTEYLRTNAEIQRQVDARFIELHSSQVQNNAGKLKAQRGGGS